MFDTDTAVRCSTWARDVDLSPIGTIGSYRGYLLVETPLPWPRDVGEVPALAGAAASAAAVGYRLQALVPSAPDADPESRRVILHAGPDGPVFAGYRRFAAQIGGPADDTVRSLLDDASSTAPTREAPGTDVLVCTHGRRDVCCGSLGTVLALQLAGEGPSPGVAVWRTSHTGGHRFAPTFIVLPQATAWAFADPTLVGQVLDRSVPFRQVAASYRGCAGLPGPEAQALEREVLKTVGWDLLDRPRSAYVTGESTSDGGSITRLESGSDRWEAVVRPGRTLPVPDCNRPLSEAKKTETELIVSDLRSLP